MAAKAKFMRPLLYVVPDDVLIKAEQRKRELAAEQQRRERESEEGTPVAAATSAGQRSRVFPVNEFSHLWNHAFTRDSNCGFMW